MVAHTLTDSERYTLINALRVAAEQYSKDAATLRAVPRAGVSPRLADQFAGQADDAEAWISKLKNAEAVIITEE